MNIIKNVLMILSILLLTVCFAHATTVVYRISSGEVLGISTTNNPFNFGNSYLAVLTDPPMPDGVEWRNPAGEERILGYAKINDNGTVRNATLVEIDGFAALREADREDNYKRNAVRYLNNHPDMKRILVALLQVLIDEQFNPTRSWFNDFKDEVAASDSLLDFKSRIAALPSWNDSVTMQNLKNAVEDEIEN